MHMLFKVVHNIESCVDLFSVLGTFDLLVLDPPWESKSVKRLKKYNGLVNKLINRIQNVANITLNTCIALFFVNH